ncbi:MAG: ion transporter [Christensenellaceae bacterium]|nr:ion transporter [Christensenellaceae bacterium]
MTVRRRIYRMVEASASKDRLCLLYNRAMVVVILISLIPLFFKQNPSFFQVLDYIAAGIMILDYILRWSTADFKLEKGRMSFLLYPLTFFALIDLISVVPMLLPDQLELQLFRIVRLVRAFRALRALRMLRYSKSFALIISVMKRERQPLLAVVWLAGGYVLLSALIMFQVEPYSFHSFFDAFYWAVVTLTTVGYGDIYPISDIGRVVSMLSSFMGIAIVALPTGLITAGFMQTLNEKKNEQEKQESDKD